MNIDVRRPGVNHRRPRDWNEIRTPRLVIEVSAPSTARYDRVVKRPAFQDAGVEEFWIVDLDARLVERWRPADARPEILVPRLIWQPEGAPQPLEIDLVAFFSECSTNIKRATGAPPSQRRSVRGSLPVPSVHPVHPVHPVLQVRSFGPVTLKRPDEQDEVVRWS